jgi:regulator of replication initiation timing
VLLLYHKDKGYSLGGCPMESIVRVPEFTETEEHLLLKLDELNRQLQQALEDNRKLKRANSNLKNDLRKARKDFANLLKSNKANQKQHYKNGKRGTKFNG